MDENYPRDTEQAVGEKMGGDGTNLRHPNCSSGSAMNQYVGNCRKHVSRSDVCTTQHEVGTPLGGCEGMTSQAQWLRGLSEYGTSEMLAAQNSASDLDSEPPTHSPGMSRPSCLARISPPAEALTGEEWLSARLAFLHSAGQMLLAPGLRLNVPDGAVLVFPTPGISNPTDVQCDRCIVLYIGGA
ncbi:hypothetical protein K466DRAFT_570499 [Polyporus arcularius HHB13444]|uniref:Uncharacterized protein n=1 Tax=Polyporus arcularius HHB13444 TaxID=1314778 RepID=A0A5C3NNC6_9APHY|nr:hypothetical protein K466DRAFT_570499 [Polyporus arcularius HHB13444]